MFCYLFLRVCPIFQISNVTGENLDLLKMFLNLLSIRAHFKKDEPSEFQIDDTYSVPVSVTRCWSSKCHSAKTCLDLARLDTQPRLGAKSHVW